MRLGLIIQAFSRVYFLSGFYFIALFSPLVMERLSRILRIFCFSELQFANGFILAERFTVFKSQKFVYLLSIYK